MAEGFLQSIVEEYIGNHKFLIGLGVAALGLGLGFGSCQYMGNMSSAEITRARLEAQPRLMRENVIGQETPDEFYMINGRRAFVRVDDKLIEKSY